MASTNASSNFGADGLAESFIVSPTICRGAKKFPGSFSTGEPMEEDRDYLQIPAVSAARGPDRRRKPSERWSYLRKEGQVAWISLVPPAQASGELSTIYQRIAGARGGVAEIHQVQALNPRALSAHFELYKAVMFQASPLSRAQREALAVVVSRANGCDYCVGHHAAALAQLPEGAEPLDPRLASWAERLARNPEGSTAADIDELRSLGMDDRAILDAVLTVAYFSYVNRLVLATGLSLEPGFELTCRPE